MCMGGGGGGAVAPQAPPTWAGHVPQRLDPAAYTVPEQVENETPGQQRYRESMVQYVKQVEQYNRDLDAWGSQYVPNYQSGGLQPLGKTSVGGENQTALGGTPQQAAEGTPAGGPPNPDRGETLTLIGPRTILGQGPAQVAQNTGGTPGTTPAAAPAAAPRRELMSLETSQALHLPYGTELGAPGSTMPWRPGAGSGNGPTLTIGTDRNLTPQELQDMYRLEDQWQGNLGGD